MDPNKIYRDALERAKLIWNDEENSDFEQEGEGVLTRQQVKETLNKTNNQTLENIDSDDSSSSHHFDLLRNIETDIEEEQVQQQNQIDEFANLSDHIDNNTLSEEDERENNSNNKDDIFNDETLIEENDLVKVYVIKTYLKRQKKFNLQDHQYILHFKKKTDKPILLKDVLDILEKSFFSILQNLKSFYKNETKNMIYMTLTQEDLFNAFRTSPYILQDNDAKNMVTHLMSNLNRFVNSNSSMKLLEKSFCVFFRVVSNVHLENSSTQRRPVTLATTVGTNTKNCFLPGGRISLQTEIKNDCLTKSVCFAILKITNPIFHEKIKKICYRRIAKKLKEEAIHLLHEFHKDVCQACNISLEGPHELKVLQILSDYFKVQIHVILSLDGGKPEIQSFPPGNNYELPRIYLQVLNGHVNIIDNLKAFFTFYKKIVCFDCRKSLNNQWRRNHKCSKIRLCFNCNGIYKTKETIEIANENIFFCDSNLPEVKQMLSFDCNNCNLTFQSHTCYDRHKKVCNSNGKGWKCPICGIFEFSRLNENRDVLIERHVCGVKKYTCTFCYKVKEENHICQISKQAGHLIWPNMAFLHVAFKDFGCANCQNCYSIQKTFCDDNNLTFAQLFKKDFYCDLLCDIHKNNSTSEVPNVISLYKEESRCLFKEHLFLDDNLLFYNINSTEEIYHQYAENPKPFSEKPFKIKKTSQNVSKDFEQTVNSKFDNSQIKTAVNKLMIFLCSSNVMSNFTVVVSDSRTLLLILKSFVELDVIPNVFQDGNKINFLEISTLKLRFVHMSCYIKGSIFDLAVQYNIPFERVYYPNIWNRNEFYNYVGNPPKLIDFLQFSDTNDEREHKKIFCSKLQAPYNFNDNLINTTRYESKLFFFCCVSFVQQCFELQDLIFKTAKNQHEKLNFIHPFGWKISSISGFTYAVFAYFFMNDEIMHTVMHPFTGSSVQVSRGEIEWTNWLNWKHFGLNILNAFNNPDGQKCFGKHFVDGYSPITKTVYQYRGCEFHFHLPPDCSHIRNKERTIESNNVFGMPMQKLKERDEKEENTLLNYYFFDVKKIEVIYECEWHKYKLNNPVEMEVFQIDTNFSKNRPLRRLTPRATLRGGFIEVYRLKFSLTDHPNYKLYFADVNSLYSHIAMTNSFPVGKYTVILNPQLLKNNIKYVNNHFYYNNEPMQGDAAHVKILPPSKLFRPYLPYRLNDEYNHMALCRSCLTKKTTKRCVHRSDENRAFTSCYQVTDLEKAVSLGYKILEWYEVHHYSERKPIFETFVKILGSLKLQSTDLFSTNDNKDIICEKINSKMNLNNLLAINPKKVKANSAQKQLYKEMLNSFYGRFALHTNFTKHFFCRNLYEIEKYASVPDNHILDIIPLTDDVCEIEIVTPTKIKPSLCGTLYLTSEINALARKFIYEEAEKIEKLNGIVLSVDTDSLIFALPENVPDPLQYSHAFGDFKHVLGNNVTIESFYSFGPRNYSITYKDSHETYHHLLKVKGLSTKSSNNCDTITPKLYKEFIEKNFASEVTNIYLPQLHKVVDKQTKKFHEILTYFNFGNDIHAKRFIVKDDCNYITYPFGYKF